MKKKHFLYLILVVTILTATSCQKTWESLKKNVQTSSRNYEIKQYSGGKLIGTYKFRGMLNDSESSDGYYFYMNGILHEISGDVVIKSTK